MSNNLKPINQYTVIQTPVMTSTMVKIQSRKHSKNNSDFYNHMADVEDHATDARTTFNLQKTPTSEFR